MSKVTVVGAGNVGATCANVLSINEIANEVVLLDVKGGIAEGKAMDINQCSQMLSFETKLVGVTNDYTKTANSDVVIITSGVGRKHGMTRADLISVNAFIVKSVCENIVKYSPNAIIIVITNPVDAMTYLALKTTGFPKNRVMGMGGALDSARFRYFISKALNANMNQVDAMVVGGHGDTFMVPLMRYAYHNEIAVSTLLSPEKQEEVVKETMIGGATIIDLMGTSSFYAPGTAGAYMAEAILRDQKKMIPTCVYLDGEYGEKDICIGAPAIIGMNGVEEILNYKFNSKEKELFAQSAEAVRSMNNVLVEMKLL